jgi:Zn-dependent protease with chaperone function
MPNFYRDNDDILFQFKHLDLDRIIELKEDKFSNKDKSDYAPRSIADARGLPLLMLVFGIFGFLIGPALNTFSRTLEMNADMTALELTRNPQAFISAMTKLTDQNLSEAQPNRLFEVLFHDHPTYVRRVELARRFISKDEKETRH